MSTHEVWSARFFIAVTIINFFTLWYFFGSGALNIGQFFIGFMIWFYGTIIVADHLWFEEEDDDDYAK